MIDFEKDKHDTPAKSITLAECTKKEEDNKIIKWVLENAKRF